MCPLIGGLVPLNYGKSCAPSLQSKNLYWCPCFLGGLALPSLPDFPKFQLEIVFENLCPYILGGPVPPPFPTRERVP